MPFLPAVALIVIVCVGGRRAVHAWGVPGIALVFDLALTAFWLVVAFVVSLYVGEVLGGEAMLCTDIAAGLVAGYAWGVRRGRHRPARLEGGRT